MIPAWKIEAIETLLREGRLSRRQIAQRLKVWRGAIRAVAEGSRPDYPTLPGTREAASPQPAGPPQRCGECGAMVHLPCRACGLRAAMPRRTPRRAATLGLGFEEGLQLALKEPQQSRYEEVRANRARQGPAKGHMPPNHKD